MSSPTLPRIIAICGRKRTGKDTVAGYISRKYGYTNAKFAEPLKAAVQGLFGFTDKQLEDDKEVVDETWEITPREAMQFMGCNFVQYELQKLMPHIGRNFFIKSLLNRHKKNRIVISDLRFLHEYEAIAQEPDSLVIKLVRPSADNGDTHISETEVDSVSPKYVIDNTGSLDKLYQRIDEIMETELRARRN